MQVNSKKNPPGQAERVSLSILSRIAEEISEEISETARGCSAGSGWQWRGTASPAAAAPAAPAGGKLPAPYLHRPCRRYRRRFRLRASTRNLAEPRLTSRQYLAWWLRESQPSRSPLHPVKRLQDQHDQQRHRSHQNLQPSLTDRGT